MNASGIRKRGGDIGFYLLLAGMCVLIQLPPLFFGVELCDSGFYLASYSNILDHPASVEYGFMHYLTAVTGAMLMKLCPGMFWMRVVGMVVNTLTAITVASVFRRKEWRAMALPAVLIILCQQFDAPLTFSYDQFSALIICLGLKALISGVAPLLPGGSRRDAPVRPGYCDRMMLVSGMLLGISIFARIPNLLAVGYIILIPIFLWRRRRGRYKWAEMGMMMTAFLAGWLTGILLVFLLMLALGHTETFFDHIRDLFSIATSTSAEVSHGSSHLIMVQIGAYLSMFKIGLAIVGVVALSWISAGLVRSRQLRFALLLFFGVAFMLLVWWRVYALGGGDFVYFLAALFILGCIGQIWEGEWRLKLAAAAGLGMILIFPLGSDFAIVNNGTQAMWMAAVPALLFYCRFIDRALGVGPRRAVRLIWIYAILISVCAIAKSTRDGVYFDQTPLWECTAEVDHPLGRGVTTSPAHARALCEMVKEIESVARPGEPVLITGTAPMLHYLTGTLPAIGNQSPGLLSADQLRVQLSRKLRYAPVVVMRIPSPAGDFSRPDDDAMRGRGEFSNIFHNEKKHEAILSTLAELGYEPVDTLRYMVVYRPVKGERRQGCY